MKRSIDFIHLFPHYSNISESVFASRLEESSADVGLTDPLVSMIFAPDPDLGLPRSDLAVVMSRDSSPEISQFIRDTLMSPNPSAASVDDPDVALEMVKSRGERLSAYAERLRGIVESYNK